MLYRNAQAIDILLPRWRPQRAPEVMLYRNAQATDILLPRWHQQHAPEVMLYRSAQCDVAGLVSCNAETAGPKVKAEVERVRLLARDRGFYKWCSGQVE